MRPTALGDAFEEQMQGEVTTFRHTLSAAGSPYAMVETNPSGTVLKTQYLHADHQGSIKAVSDTSGAVIERMGYDAWGKRSDALSHSTTRGYTAHEMLDNVGLIHMNGGVYDPLLARFLSVDPINQAPDNAQSYNPYSYVFNSPMMFTDPSGFSAWAKYRRPVVGVAASVLTYGMATYAMTGVWFAADVTGAAGAKLAASVLASGVGGGVQSGTMEGALKGAAMGAAFFGVGSAAGMIAEMGGTNAAIAARSVQVVGHAAVACAGAVASGGQCGPAALAQGFTSGVSPYLPDGYVAGTIAHAGVGAVAARLAGGDTRQGALTGAFAYLFNECAHGNCTTKLEQTLYDWWPGYKAGTLLRSLTVGDGSWTAWELLDAASIGTGVAAKGLSAGLNGGANSVKHLPHLRDAYLRPALEGGWIEMTIPDKPQSSKQKYRLTQRGLTWLAAYQAGG
ncbi:MAG: hypothetical protein RL210_1292, partial [Pseudomonadota bacterium]